MAALSHFGIEVRSGVLLCGHRLTPQTLRLRLSDGAQGASRAVLADTSNVARAGQAFLNDLKPGTLKMAGFRGRILRKAMLHATASFGWCCRAEFRCRPKDDKRVATGRPHGILMRAAAKRFAKVPRTLCLKHRDVDTVKHRAGVYLQRQKIFQGKIYVIQQPLVPGLRY